jgi:hypothetical protein
MCRSKLAADGSFRIGNAKSYDHEVNVSFQIQRKGKRSANKLMDSSGWNWPKAERLLSALDKVLRSA